MKSDDDPRHFVLDGNELLEVSVLGETLRRWTAPSRATALRCLALLEALDALAALDARGSLHSIDRDLPAFGCLDRFRLFGLTRDALDHLHSAGFTARIGCRFDVLARGRP